MSVDPVSSPPGERSSSCYPQAILVSASYRHRTLNVLQVALGWMQMGKHRQASEALENFTTVLAAEREWVYALPAELSGYLVLASARAEQVAVAFQVSVAETNGHTLTSLPVWFPELRQVIDGTLSGENASSRVRSIAVDIFPCGLAQSPTVRVVVQPFETAASRDSDPRPRPDPYVWER